jgi:hypothetical protein
MEGPALVLRSFVAARSVSGIGTGGEEVVGVD